MKSSESPKEKYINGYITNNINIRIPSMVIDKGILPTMGILMGITQPGYVKIANLELQQPQLEQLHNNYNYN
jgi:hypothetical protein